MRVYAGNFAPIEMSKSALCFSFHPTNGALRNVARSVQRFSNLGYFGVISNN